MGWRFRTLLRGFYGDSFWREVICQISGVGSRAATAWPVRTAPVKQMVLQAKNRVPTVLYVRGRRRCCLSWYLKTYLFRPPWLARSKKGFKVRSRLGKCYRVFRESLQQRPWRNKQQRPRSGGLPVQSLSENSVGRIDRLRSSALNGGLEGRPAAPTRQNLP